MRRASRAQVLAGTVVALALGAGLGWSGARATVASHLAPPKLLSLRYGRFRPHGARHAYLALKLRARERHGQVIENEFKEVPFGFNADALSGCGLGGRRNGGVETFFVPVTPRFAKGAHRIRVTAFGSSCNRRHLSASASRTFTITVR